MEKEKLVLVTGEDAYDELVSLDLNLIKQKFEIVYEKISVKIAAFISKQHILRLIEKYEQDPLNHWFLVSGLIPWDLDEIEGKFKGRIKKGPKFLSNLKEVLKKMHPSQFSSKEPADKIIKFDSANELNEKIKEKKTVILKKIESGDYSSGFSISSKYPNIIFSDQLPPLIIAEIVDAPLLSNDDILKKVGYFLDSGADVIDIGCVANTDNSKRIFEIVSIIKSHFDCPVSIDSLNPSEIIHAVRAGADLVLSITMDNLQELNDLPKDISLVCVPLENSEKEQSINGRMSKLVMIGNRLNVLGFSKILLDPILDPPINPGLSESLETYFLLTDAIQSIPSTTQKPLLLMGIGNVTELIDSDSQGINTLLSVIAIENQIAGILTTEYSNKMRGAIKELRNAINLAFYAKLKNQTPIKLGISAFRSKGKQKYPRIDINTIPNSKLITIKDEEDLPTDMDKKGFLKIYLHHPEKHIIVSFYTYDNKKDPERVYIGKNPINLYKQIINDGIIGSLSHAAYLGKELAKAKHALDYGGDYVQDGI